MILNLLAAFKIKNKAWNCYWNPIQSQQKSLVAYTVEQRGYQMESPEHLHIQLPISDSHSSRQGYKHDVPWS